MKSNIIITSAGQRVSLVKDFQETLRRFFPDGKVYTTDMNPRLAPAAYVSDGCFEVPRCTSEDYIESLLSICLGNDIGLIVPTIDTELAVLAANRDVFIKQGIYVSVSDYDFVMMCRDKRNTGAFFEKNGIRVPKPIDKYHPTFPLFAKPYDGSLSTNLHYIKNAEELTEEVFFRQDLHALQRTCRQTELFAHIRSRRRTHVRTIVHYSIHFQSACQIQHSFSIYSRYDIVLMRQCMSGIVGLVIACDDVIPHLHRLAYAMHVH